MSKTKIRMYLALDVLIMVIGLALCGLSIYGLYSNIAIELLVFVSTMGAIMTMLGSSLLIDLIKFNSSLKKSNIQLQF